MHVMGTADVPAGGAHARAVSNTLSSLRDPLAGTRMFLIMRVRRLSQIEVQYAKLLYSRAFVLMRIATSTFVSR